MTTTLLASALASIALLLAPPPETPPAVDGSRIPASVFVTEAPKDAKCVSEVKKSAKKGDTVVYSKYGGTEITVDGQDVLILNAHDVLAVIK